MLRTEDLCFTYNKQGRLILNKINIELADGEIGIVLGKNGSGKTTLFTNILGINKPISGAVYFDEKDLSKMSHHEKAKVVAYVPQHIHFGDLSVFEAVLLGRVSHYNIHESANDYKIVENILSEMGLENLAGRNAEELSGGEKQKIAIARAMAQEPQLLIFDEPTGNLDLANEHLIIEEAKRLSKCKGISILSSLHNLNQAINVGDKFFFLKDGVMRYCGGKELFTSDIIKEIFDVDMRIANIDGQTIIY